MINYFSKTSLKASKTFYLTLSAFLLAGSFSMQSSAATYFACDSGYQFQVKNGAARCYKASKMLTKKPLACGNVFIPIINKSIGHFLRKDYQGRADKCVGTFKVGPVTNSNALDLACPSGYRLKVVRGADRCEKRVPAKAVAPTRRVSR
ncbi:MAG: hypothetical protein ACRBCS_09960 [Cellvibrionaceae bacterium]